MNRYKLLLKALFAWVLFCGCCMNNCLVNKNIGETADSCNQSPIYLAEPATYHRGFADTLLKSIGYANGTGDFSRMKYIIRSRGARDSAQNKPIFVPDTIRVDSLSRLFIDKNDGNIHFRYNQTANIYEYYRHTPSTQLISKSRTNGPNDSLPLEKKETALREKKATAETLIHMIEPDTARKRRLFREKTQKVYIYDKDDKHAKPEPLLLSMEFDFIEKKKDRLVLSDAHTVSFAYAADDSLLSVQWGGGTLKEHPSSMAAPVPTEAFINKAKSLFHQNVKGAQWTHKMAKTRKTYLPQKRQNSTVYIPHVSFLVKKRFFKKREERYLHVSCYETN